MKNSKRFFLIALVAFSAITSKAQITSASEMAQKIFAAVKAKDEKAFLALHPNKEQMMGLVSKMMKGIMAEMKKSPEMAKELQEGGENVNMDSLITAQLMKKASPEEMAKMDQKHAEEFNAMIKKGEEKGINWENIVLSKADIDTVTVADESMVKMFGSDKFRTMKGVLHFTSGTKGYQLSFSKVLFLPEEGGWYGVKLNSVASDGETLTDISDKDDEKVTVESDDEMPPPAKKKQTTKSKSATGKTKTKPKL